MSFMQPVLADWEFALIIPVMALLIPIVAILSHHQRKMAEIIHRNTGDNQLIANLQRELFELRQLVHQHAVALDDLGMKPLQTQSPQSPPPPLRPGGY
jgi:hypothetical protein